MPSFEQIKGEEERRVSGIRKRIYQKFGQYTSIVTDVDPIPDPTWQKVWIGECLIDTIVSKIYARNMGGWPRRDGLPEIESRLDPLLWCLRARGREDFIITNDLCADEGPEGKPACPQYYRCALDMESIRGAVTEMGQNSRAYTGNPHQGSDDYPEIAFDDTAEWVLADDGHLDCPQQLLAGTPEFMNQYVDAAGGEDYVRAWFYHYDIHEYNNDAREEYVQSGFKKRNPYCDFIEKKYAYVGWPVPWALYPPDGPWEGYDTDWTPMFEDRIKSSGPWLPGADG
jgi:hypothetical protein